MVNVYYTAASYHPRSVTGEIELFVDLVIHSLDLHIIINAIAG